MDVIQDFLTNIKDALAPVVNYLTRVLIAGFPFIDAFIILAAGLGGASLYGRCKGTLRGLLLKLLGVAVLLFGVNELWNTLFVLKEGRLEAKGTLLVVASVLVGWLFGEALMLDSLLGKLGILLSRLFAAKPTPAEVARSAKNKPTPELIAADNRRLRDCADGFVMATVLCGFSSLLFTGFLEGRMSGTAGPMLVKLIFDLVLVFALAAAFGNGPSFAAIPVLVAELLMWLVDAKWGEILTVDLLAQTSLVGSVILIVGGICIMLGKRFRAANLIPALFLPAICTLTVNKITDIVEDKVDKK